MLEGMRALSLFALLSFASLATADAIDDMIAKEMAERKIPGFQVAVIDNGQIAKLGLYGIARKPDTKVTAETRFNIGSITKQFTATAVMLLQEDGKLSVDDSVRKWVAELPESWDEVKVFHLLNHTAGTVDWGSLPGFKFQTSTEAEFLSELAKWKPTRKPGERYEYSNVGYTLLGVIISRAAGKPYMDFVEERIFRKLGMDQTTYIRSEWPSFAAYGYFENGNRGGTRRAAVTNPSGGVLSTAGDLLKLDQALYTDALLKPESREAMWTGGLLTNGSRTRYGFGWNVDKTEQGLLTWHQGTTAAGFKSFMYRDTGRKVTVIVLANRGGDWPISTLARAIHKEWIEKKASRRAA